MFAAEGPASHNGHSVSLRPCECCLSSQSTSTRPNVAYPPRDLDLTLPRRPADPRWLGDLDVALDALAVDILPEHEQIIERAPSPHRQRRYRCRRVRGWPEFGVRHAGTCLEFAKVRDV